ncbi:MAG TPA: ABC transporter permease [Actinomycetota bacterium]|nr:ABC transporter permease [Actinomycetota bacterium]
MDTAVRSGRTARPRRSWFERTFITPRAARITAPVLFLAAWQLIAPMIPSAILPMPAEVAEAMWEQLRDGTLVEAFSVSLLRLAIGFSMALVVGSVVGLAMGLSPRIEAMLHDFVVVGLTFPYLIWGLLVAMWFGYGWIGPVLVVFIAGLPYVILNMSEGVHDVSKELRDMAAAYEVPRDRELRHLVIPSLSPFFFASLRYGLANGWKGLILAEVFASTSGAGWHITSMRDYGDFAGVVGFAIYFALFSIVVERLVFGRLSRRVFRWRPSLAREMAEPPELTI